MNMPDVNTNALCVAVICLLLGAFAFATYYFLERKRISAEEHDQNERVLAERTAAPRVSWDGDQYDWTPEAMAYLNDPYQHSMPAPTMPQPALLLPDAHPSGPMPARRPLPVPVRRRTAPQPVQPPQDDFIARLRADNQAFMEQWAIR
jgi:hypothetical protein